MRKEYSKPEITEQKVVMINSICDPSGPNLDNESPDTELPAPARLYY